ncbi:maltose O-acetyltransferase [Sphingobacterium cellulitidis]|uniref:sugar O-acetyltransferase n=1 Tax=Sphingobacterium cellulitidis TaxID=1768011 RepID=UPI000B93FE16|nr:sugar O-acetyltransferase [Sphingobacterium cellulitidis]OYD46800.1 maltose O-acetyltransferase [Sphingobacterium cellulitidis]
MNKTSKEKMIAGEPYIASGDELFRERQHAKVELQKFNLMDPTKIKARNQIIKKLFGKTTSRFFIEPPFYCDYGYNIEVGDNFYSNYNLTILDCAKVIIGDNVMIAPNVSLFTAGHPVDAVLRVEGWEYAMPIEIGDNVWIGGNTVINPGVKIGANSVIGSGSVVTKDIPDNVVAAGNPCKVIREINARDKVYYFRDKKFDFEAE